MSRSAVTPGRVVLAIAFVFVLFNVRPLVTTNPSDGCVTPQLIEAFKPKNAPEPISAFKPKEADQRNSDSVLDLRSRGLAILNAGQTNQCIDEARSAVFGATGRLAFFAALGGGVAVIFGWRPSKGNGARRESQSADDMASGEPPE